MDDFDEQYTKLFFPSAIEYWVSLRDNLRNEKDLKSILLLLREIPASSRGNAPWGTVNIVGHGSPYAWYMRKYEYKNDHEIEGKSRPDSLTESDLPDPALGVVPRADVLDGDSLVVLRGCEIGTNQALLDAIHAQFGVRPKGYAPVP